MVLLLTVVSVAACTGNPQDTFDTAGPIAKSQADLFNFILIFGIVVFVIVEGAILYVSWRYRSGKRKGMPKQVHGNVALEVTWTIIPAIILVAIAIPTIQTIWETATPPEEGMNMTAIGHQWWFEFRYPEQGIITANEMYIPAGEDIIIKLESEDVIHSFWVPKLAGKVDMVPINENTIWLKADEPGIYYGQCAEFCGIAHAHMRFRVIAQSPEDFAKWSDDWFIPPDAPAPGSPEAEGQALFLSNCSTCHTVNSHSRGSYDAEILAQTQRWDAWQNAPETSLLVSAPNLTHFGNRFTLGAGVDDLTTENLVKWIQNPAEIKPGTRMQQNAVVYRRDPAMANSRTDAEAAIKLAPEDVEKIAAYLMSLKPGSPTQEASAETTDEPEIAGRSAGDDNG